MGGVLALAMGPLNLLCIPLLHSVTPWQQMATDACSIALLSIAVAMSMTVLGADVDHPAPSATHTPEVEATHAADDMSAVHLTNRELEVLSLMAKGYSNLMIAGRLHVTESTVKGYVESIFVRLNARNRAEAVAVASRLSLIPTGVPPP
jgi:DNA-binding NarL/FixJ family response regulator